MSPGTSSLSFGKMDIEKLKMVIDLLTQMGAQGGDLFVWYIVVINIIEPIIWASMLVAIAWIASRVVMRCSNAVKWCKESRSALRVGCSGALSEDEQRQAVDRINQLWKIEAAWRESQEPYTK